MRTAEHMRTHQMKNARTGGIRTAGKRTAPGKSQDIVKFRFGGAPWQETS